jgi:predicted dehydrogenase
MKRIIRFGIIGCGLMGREFASAAARWCHLLDLDAQPQVVAICNRNAAKFDWFTHNFDTIQLATTNYRELLADPRVEAVYCALPHNLHAEVYTDILHAGKHLLGEKPFGMDRTANDQINAAIRAHPELLVRCSSEFPFYPGAQKIVQFLREGRFGQIIEVEAGLWHSSDLNPNKPINWKRMIAYNGEYGCLGDLGMHVVHLPFRFGWFPANVRALLSKIVRERPDGQGGMAPCETWDNATLACEVDSGGQHFPLTLSTKRIAPGEANTWFIRVLGTRFSAEFSTKYPRTLKTLAYTPGGEQAWQSTDLGYESVYRTISGAIFEFGFTDAMLQMIAAYCDELARGSSAPFPGATPEEAALSHRLFTAALESQRAGQVVNL